MPVTLKCRKCRKALLLQTDNSSQSVVINAHGENLSSQSKETSCSSDSQDNHWFLEESATPWIADVISKSDWTKGKLNCPNCEARLGSFDFVSRLKCACGSSVLPAIQLVKSKVDCSFQDMNLLSSLK